ncbi:uncharacterized protein CTHT_0073470 [Thermochaetoides thermophila DSM 1495]|uniref:Uncharacterized protein n=1 Tax=Chaetomium thermophilum (strain DSM 1495 / CBS 144.50 / IMI 039719) TaxID=759272 RepID=G0SHV1_CHATD|nr:hypothetical protein CTHT_0073470 [Thermochaetoides thermophila DSM 1495]EGS17021.1 hypothetical protein CTHT_0073470 [Thermochaetoides thermophila DSM 1495]
MTLPASTLKCFQTPRVYPRELTNRIYECLTAYISVIKAEPESHVHDLQKVNSSTPPEDIPYTIYRTKEAARCAAKQLSILRRWASKENVVLGATSRFEDRSPTRSFRSGPAAEPKNPVKTGAELTVTHNA